MPAHAFGQLGSAGRRAQDGAHGEIREGALPGTRRRALPAPLPRSPARSASMPPCHDKPWGPGCDTGGDAPARHHARLTTGRRRHMWQGVARRGRSNSTTPLMGGNALLRHSTPRTANTATPRQRRQCAPQHAQRVASEYPQRPRTRASRVRDAVQAARRQCQPRGVLRRARCACEAHRARTQHGARHPNSLRVYCPSDPVCQAGSPPPCSSPDRVLGRPPAADVQQRNPRRGNRVGCV